MKHLLLTTIAAVVLVETAFADPITIFWHIRRQGDLVLAIRAITCFSTLTPWIGDKVTTIRAIHSRHSGMTILPDRTYVYAASFWGKMFQNSFAPALLTSLR